MRRARWPVIDFMKTAPKFRHFVLTLFNLKIWNKDKTNTPTHTDEWLSDRFDIFEKYCLPSMMAQECKDFIWVVFFDSDTPQKYKTRIMEYETLCPQFRPCYMDANEASLFRAADADMRCRPIRELVKNCLEGGDEYVITTNLDNDDALSVDAVGRIQRALNLSPTCGAIIFPWGMQYISAIGMILKMFYPHNHFMSLVEKTDSDIKTIHYFIHTKVRKQMPVIDVDGGPGWLEIVHGTNVSNELRITSRIKYRLCFRKSTLSGFGLDISFSFAHNVMAALVKYPAYFLRIACVKIRKKLLKR